MSKSNKWRSIIPKPKDAERRYDEYGEWRLMAATEGYVMARRKGAGAICMSEAKWSSISAVPVSLSSAIRRQGQGEKG